MRDVPHGHPPTLAPDGRITGQVLEQARRAIEDALAENGGNRTRTAKQLGISLRALQYRLKEYNLNLEELS